MSSPLFRSIAGAAAIVIVSACGGTSAPSGPSLPATYPASVRAGRHLHRATMSPQAGTLFVADFIDNDVAILATGGPSSEPFGTSPRGTITSGISQPRVLATDTAGDLFVGNAGDNSIKEYPVGSTTPSLTIKNVYVPQGLAVDAQGNLWVSQLSTPQAIFPVVDEYAYNASNKTFASKPAKTIVGSGAASLVFPHGLAFDSSGNLFIADTGHSGAVLEVKAGSSTPSLVPLPAVAPPSGSAPVTIEMPYGIAVGGSGSDEALAVTDFAVGTVISFSLGASKPAYQVPPVSPAQTNLLWLAVDGNGFVYMSGASGAMGSAPVYFIAQIDPNGKASYEPGLGAKLPEGIAFTTAAGSTAARNKAKRNI
jgi:hypothetical protein